MPKVFILEPFKNSFNIETAKEFGEIVYLFEREDKRPSIFDSNVFGSRILDRLKEKLFNPMVDKICIVGAMVPVTIFIAATITRFDEIHVLFYSSNEERYVSRTIGSYWWPER